MPTPPHLGERPTADVVVVALEPWDGPWGRTQHLLARMLADEPSLRVLVVEPATDPLHAALGADRPRRGRGLRRGPGLDGVARDALWLFEPTKWLPRSLDARVGDRWARQVIRAARAVDMTAPVLWVEDPAGSLLVTATTWPALYDVTADRSLAERPTAELELFRAQEQVLLERCAEVVVGSEALAREKGAGRPVTVVPNGADTAAAERRPARPDDLPPAPVALHAGPLRADRLDVELCIDLSTALAGLSGGPGRLVLRGPDTLQRRDADRLREAGVLVLDTRHDEDASAYLRHADVLVLPYVVNAFTDSLDPIPLHEYAVAARPVVATPVAAARAGGNPLLECADGAVFVHAVARALTPEAAPAGPTGPGAAPLAGPAPSDPDGHDWSDRADRMLGVLARVRASG